MAGFSWTRFMAVLKKEFIQTKRDVPSVIMAVVMPVVMLLLFGYAVNTDVDHIPMVVWDQSMTADSREVVQALRNSTYLDPDQYVQGYGEIEDAMNSAKARAALIIPPDYGKAIQGGDTATLQVFVDGADPTTARAALSAVQAVGTERAWQLQSERMNLQGLGGAIGRPIEVETRVWYNPEMKSTLFNIPALIGLILQNVIALLTAFSLVREKERGTMEQLVVTPIRPVELLLGKLVPFVGIGFVAFAVALLMAIFWFDVVPQGSWVLLILLSILFLVTILAIGLLISTIASTQIQAMQMTVLLVLPSILLSGFIFPRETMPLFLQALGGMIPLTYYITIMRGIFLKGVGLEYLWQDTLILLVFLVGILTLAMKKFKKNLD
ncbi:ABC transporter permease [Heliophilum fasciatum]|uniref:ABC transporter permease n=1 Tax=Heliophilum fasciatum TaxID=35700 RepID=UPI00104539F0